MNKHILTLKIFNKRVSCERKLKDRQFMNHTLQGNPMKICPIKLRDRICGVNVE